MNIDKRWLFATAAFGAAAGAAVTTKLLRRRQVLAQHSEDVADLKSWENEGGNLAPHALPPATHTTPAALSTQGLSD